MHTYMCIYIHVYRYIYIYIYIYAYHLVISCVYQPDLVAQPELGNHHELRGKGRTRQGRGDAERV